MTSKLRLYALGSINSRSRAAKTCPFQTRLTAYSTLAQPSRRRIYRITLGYAAPNSTTNVGADYILPQRLILTGRFGYYFENYHDFGFPTTGTLNIWLTNGVGATDAFGASSAGFFTATDGFLNVANSPNFTAHNASKAIQVDVDMAWFKSGWKGTHNFKFGYQLNRLNNDY